MSEKSSTKTTFDSRSFIEIYFALPESARSELTETLTRKDITRTTIYNWLHGGNGSPTRTKVLKSTLRAKYGIVTKAETLFPAKDTRDALAFKYASYIQDKGPKKARVRWNGKPKWPSLNDED